MKRSALILICVLAAVFSALPASAASKSVSFGGVKCNVDDNFTVIDPSKSGGSGIEGLLFAAFTRDGAQQIQARCISTDFSKNIGTFSGLDGETAAPVGKKLFPDGYELYISPSGTVFFKNSTFVTDGITVEYVTVSDGKLYTFTYFGNDASRMGEFIGTVKLPESASSDHTSVYVTVLIVVFIIADAAFIFVIALSFVRDYRRYKMEHSENIVSQYIKIKRR